MEFYGSYLKICVFVSNIVKYRPKKLRIKNHFYTLNWPGYLLGPFRSTSLRIKERVMGGDGSRKEWQNVIQRGVVGAKKNDATHLEFFLDSFFLQLIFRSFVSHEAMIITVNDNKNSSKRLRCVWYTCIARSKAL